MKHIIFGSKKKFKHAILIKPSALRKKEISHYYISEMGVDPEDVIAFDLDFPENQKKNPSIAMAKNYLVNLLKGLDSLGVENILVADTVYFKQLTKQQKVENSYGYVFDSQFDEFENRFNVVVCPNYNAIFHNPASEEKIKLSLKTFKSFIEGTYEDLHGKVIKKATYFYKKKEILNFINNELPKYPELAVDIEGFSLKFYKSKLATLGFAWNKHEGVVFNIDLQNKNTEKIKKALKNFFKSYNGKLIYHNANFDMKVICYELFMKDIDDTEGMVEGIKELTKNFDDTKLITYLALNNTARADLSLKNNTHEFTGSYAVDVKDITKIPVLDLMEYNLTDCCATHYLKEKNYPIMVKDNQLEIYETIFKPAVKNLLQMELTGLPLIMENVSKAEEILKEDLNKSIEELSNFPEVKKTIHHIKVKKF